MKKSFFQRKRRKNKKKLEGLVSKLGTLNLILICVFVYTVIFNQQMITLYRQCGSAPESAWCALIAALIGECGICGWIRTNKDKQQDRQYEKETKARDAPDPSESRPVNENDPPEDEPGDDETEEEE